VKVTTFTMRMKRVFVMFANNHHDVGHVAVWLLAPIGMQASLIEASPQTFFRPPHVGTKGALVQIARVGEMEAIERFA
jgi:hypothetical protein